MSDVEQIGQRLSSARVEDWPDGGPHVIAVAALLVLVTISAVTAGMWLLVLRGLH
jgi:hypothetical protein